MQHTRYCRSIAFMACVSRSKSKYSCEKNPKSPFIMAILKLHQKPLKERQRLPCTIGFLSSKDSEARLGGHNLNDLVAPPPSESRHYFLFPFGYQVFHTSFGWKTLLTPLLLGSTYSPSSLSQRLKHLARSTAERG